MVRLGPGEKGAYPLGTLSVLGFLLGLILGWIVGEILWDLLRLLLIK